MRVPLSPILSLLLLLSACNLLQPQRPESGNTITDALPTDASTISWNEVADWPSDRINLETYEEAQVTVVKITPIAYSYLAVCESGFSFLWKAHDEQIGPDGMFETRTLTLADLQHLL